MAEQTERKYKFLKNSPIDDQKRQIMKRDTLRIDDAYRATEQARKDRRTPAQVDEEFRQNKASRDASRVEENRQAEEKRFKALRSVTDAIGVTRAAKRYAPKAATREKRTTDSIDPRGIITKGVRP